MFPIFYCNEYVPNILNFFYFVGKCAAASRLQAKLVSRQMGFDVLSDSPWWYFRKMLITDILTGIPNSQL